MSNVTVSYNNQVEAAEAAQTLGCAYSTIVALLSKRKLKGQKINRRWFVDYDDLQRAKSTNLIKTRISRIKRERMASSSQLKVVKNEPEKTSDEKAEVRFYVDKEKLNILQMALTSVDKNVSQFVHEKLEELHQKIKDSLKNLKV